MPDFDRRTLLKSAAGAVGLTAVDPVEADGRSRYVVVGVDPEVRERVEGSGFGLRHVLAGGRVLIAEGEPDAEDRLREVPAVADAAGDRQLSRSPSTGGRGVQPEPADGEFSAFQWDKRVTGVPEAHETATGEGTRIAVMDTGIWPEHPDLAANVNRDLGRTFTADGPVAETADYHGHGTHVAGIAAADGDGKTAAPDDGGIAAPVGGGIVGTAPDAELVSLAIWYRDDVDGDGDPEEVATLSAPLLALDYAIDIGADVVNMSWGGWFPALSPADGRVLQRAVDLLLRHAPAKTVSVAAAGNDNSDLRRSRFTYPASIRRAVTVSATGPDDLLSYYSSFGEGVVDLAAPGGGYERPMKTRCAAAVDRPEGRGEVCGMALVGDPEQCIGCDLPEWPAPTNGVYSSIPPDSVVARELGVEGEQYVHLQGTSMAAPQVAGTVALIRDVAPELPGRRVERILAETAASVPGEDRTAVGAGRLDAAGAVAAAE